EHVDDKPYGVDVVMPASYAGAGELDPDRMADQLQSMIPEQHRQWLDKVLTEYGVPPLTAEDDRPEGLLGWVHEKGREQGEMALALGCDGVWTGSIWLTTAESDMSPLVVDKLLHASSRDTVRSRSWTGKPARMLRTDWTDIWERDDSPGTLPMPLQYMLISEAQRRIAKYQVKELTT